VLEEESAVDTVSDDAAGIAVEPSADVAAPNVVPEKTSEPEADTPTSESSTSETSDHPGPAGVDEEIEAKRGELADLEEVIAERRHELDRVQAELDQASESDLRGRLVELNDALVLQEVGIY